MKHAYLKFALASSLIAITALSAQAAPVILGLPGTTSFDGWERISNVNNPGFPGFGDPSAWPAPIGSNVAGSGDATLMKTGNGAGGGPAPLSSSLYFSGGSSTTLGGSVSISDSTPLLNLHTLVLQLEIGESAGNTFFNSELPTLKINGGTEIGVPLYFGVIDRVQTGTFTPPPSAEDPTPEAAPIWRNTWGFQWDINTEVTSFSIEWSQVGHTQTYAMQLDQSDTALGVSLVPEPGAPLLLCATVLGACVGNRRRRR